MGIYLHFDNFFFSKFVFVGPQNWTGKKAVIEKTGKVAETVPEKTGKVAETVP